MTIKHLVISGGGPIMIQIMSAIQELERKDFLNLENIETIYGTSAGAIIGIMISLKFDWETLNDYIIKRPWHDVFPIKVQNILDAYTKKGIFDIKTIEKCFKPLFDAKDIPLDINMADFYELTKIELHMFSFEVNEYKLVDISYKTHPDLKLLQAIQMTSALPILVTPVFIEDKCFIDGGIGCNYPLSFCIDSGKEPDEVLGFKNKYSDERSYINRESTLLDYILSFLYKAIFNIHNNYIQPIIKNEVICDASYLTIDVFKSTLSNIDVRRELFEKGKQAANKFLDTIDLDKLQDSI
jgi:predicted acylesterase/phospholipase RssA